MVLTCNIKGNLLDSGINPVGATLEVTAEVPIVDDSTTPDSIILPAPRTFTIPNTGVVNITLPRSEVARTAYILKLNAPGYFKEWKTVIPDQAEVELAALLPTTYTTDRSSTASYIIAKEITTNPRMVTSLVNGLGIVKQPTAPPGPTSAANVIWVDTSTGLTWNWNDDADDWLSPNFTMTLDVMDAAATVSLERHLPNPLAKTVVRLESVSLRWNVQSAPNDGSNRWSLQPQYRLASSATPVNIGAAVVSNPGGYTVGTARTQLVVVGQNFQYASLDAVLFALTKTGTPGPVNASATFNYRFFAT